MIEILSYSLTRIRFVLYFLTAIKIVSADIQYIKAQIIPIVLKRKFTYHSVGMNQYPKVINDMENLPPSNEANNDPAIINRTPKTKTIE